MVWIIMGVSGSGKTTIGRMLASELGIPFYDADGFHPPDNIKKMSSGRPLDDQDRKPWLETLAREIRKWNSNDGAVLACSALKKSYRVILASKSRDEDVQFIYLKGDRDTILKRMKSRSGHYMPPELLSSQFDALEEPADAISVSINKTPQVIVNEILACLS